MKVVVQIYPCSTGPSRRSEARALEIACGQGEQLVRWLAYAACLKLDYVRRGVTRKHLPQAVIGKDGLVIDIDHVLKEVRLPALQSSTNVEQREVHMCRLKLICYLHYITPLCHDWCTWCKTCRVA
jgi:hypothetical protein